MEEILGAKYLLQLPNAPLKAKQLFEGKRNPGEVIHQVTDDITGRTFHSENTGGLLRAATRPLALCY